LVNLDCFIVGLHDDGLYFKAGAFNRQDQSHQSCVRSAKHRRRHAIKTRHDLPAQVVAKLRAMT
jgi:hypothetical protein